MKAKWVLLGERRVNTGHIIDYYLRELDIETTPRYEILIEPVTGSSFSVTASCVEEARMWLRRLDLAVGVVAKN